MPGPAPKSAEQRRRQNPTIPMVQLPGEGRTGPAPEWPLPTCRAAERKVWDEVWQTPQAAVWEKLGWFRSVARYVRMLVEAEKPKAIAALSAEVRQMEDRLGLTPMSMMRLRWEIVPDEVRAARTDTPPTVRRLKAVDADAVERSG